MADPFASPCVLVVADRDRIGELVVALSELRQVEVLVSSGGDDTIELFEARLPAVVVVTASLQHGDVRSLVVKLRGMLPRAEVAIVVVGDDAGPIRTALDALDLAPDRFVTRPLSPKALRFAVTGGIDAVRIVRGGTGTPRTTQRLAPIVSSARLGSEPGLPSLPPLPVPASLPAPPAPAPSAAAPLPPPPQGTLSASGLTRLPIESPGVRAVALESPVPLTVHEAPTAATRAALRARWDALADSIIDGEDEAGDPAGRPSEVASSQSDPGGAPAILIKPRRHTIDGSLDPLLVAPLVAAAAAPVAGAPPSDEPLSSGSATAGGDSVMRGGPSGDESATPDEGSAAPVGGAGVGVHFPPALRAPDPAELPLPRLPPLPPLVRAPEPIDEPVPSRETAVRERGASRDSIPVLARTNTGDGQVVVTARTSSDEVWSEAMPISELVDRESRIGVLLPGLDDDVRAPSSAPTMALDSSEPSPGRTGLVDGGDDEEQTGERGLPILSRTVSSPTPFDDLDDLEDLDDESVLGREANGTRRAARLVPDGRSGFDDGDDLDDDRDDASDRGSGEVTRPRDFARELRAKMSMMARRLFHSDAAAPALVDHAPRHDHHTEIDLAALGDEPALGIPEIEARAEQRREIREAVASSSVVGAPAGGAQGVPGAWDSQVRERGLPDSGALIRGVSDAALLLAKMFTQGATGRIGFRRDDVETVIHFDRGRPVFASSNEPSDRMGELLLREGKITASQYERCQTVVAESGRRMGEILVGFGYLKRRELLPAVRRHVEDLVYSLFSWDRGSYRITLDPQPCAERIRLSRHPAALILEGIRRKLDRSTIERLVGPPSTVLEVPDRERLGGIVHLGDLAAEERAALAAFDGQADLAQVARSSGIDVADLLPLAWGLCVLGLATARRADTDVPDEGAPLVGETDLAIDRERVRARWQLVSDADYFALLGVRRDATGFEIRRAYQSARRDFAAECFPGDLQRELARELDEIAHVLDEAFRVLRDDRLRQTYLANLIDD